MKKRGATHTKKQPARKDSSSNSISQLNRDHYPPRDLPVSPRKVIKAIRNSPRPTVTQLGILEDDINRARRKIEWSDGRPDKADRRSSANGTMSESLWLFKKLAVAGTKANTSQSKRAQSKRVKVSDDGETITQIISGLALRNNQEESAKELWRIFFSKLDSLHLDPKEICHPTDLKKNRYEYLYGFDKVTKKDKRRKITFGQFANVVSDYRTGKKSG